MSERELVTYVREYIVDDHREQGYSEKYPSLDAALEAARASFPKTNRVTIWRQDTEIKRGA